jgi:hypothetical protein
MVKKYLTWLKVSPNVFGKTHKIFPDGKKIAILENHLNHTHPEAAEEIKEAFGRAARQCSGSPSISAALRNSSIEVRNHGRAETKIGVTPPIRWVLI